MGMLVLLFTSATNELSTGRVGGSEWLGYIASKGVGNASKTQTINKQDGSRAAGCLRRSPDG